MAMILTEADYGNDDKKRTHAADELAWLDFETKIRDKIRELIGPMIDMCTEDREELMKFEERESDMVTRLDLLDKAVFKKDKSLGITIFDTFNDKLSNMQIYLVDQL